MDIDFLRQKVNCSRIGCTSIVLRRIFEAIYHKHFSGFTVAFNGNQPTQRYRSRRSRVA